MAGELATGSQLDGDRAGTRIQQSLREPVTVFIQVSEVALDFIPRETSQTFTAPCTGPTIPVYQRSSRPSPLLPREEQEAQLEILPC